MSDLCSAGPAAASDPEKEIEDALLHHRIRQMGRKLLVLSGKGGVGKSTVAANLAVGLARAGKRVGLLDVDIHGPSIPKLLGVDQQQPEMVGGELRPVRVNHCLGIMSIGLLLCDAATPVIWRGPRKFGAIRQLLKDVAWGELDYLVVDSPPGTGDEPLAIAELLAGQKSCDGGCDNVQALIVTTPQDLAVADVRRCVSFCRMLNLPVAGIIENMSGFACPGCGQVIDLFKKEGGRRLAAEMGVAFLGAIPIDPCVVVGGDAGQPVVMATGQSPAANAFSSVVQLLLKSPATSVADTAKVRLPVAGPQNNLEDNRMKIAVPVENGRLCTHFGHCAEFAVYDVDPDTRSTRSMTMHVPPPHEPGVLPAWLHELGANVIITGGMGQRARQLFAENAIQVVIGAPPDPVDTVVANYLAGSLQTGANPCDH